MINTCWRPNAGVELSLQRLGTDHVSMLQLHSCSEEILREGAVDALLRP